MNIKMKNGNILGVLQDQTKTEQGLYIPDNKSYNKIEVVEPVDGVNIAFNFFALIKIFLSILYVGDGLQIHPST